MKYHSFSVEDAKKFGIEKAILLQNLRHWLEKEYANRNRNHSETERNLKIHRHTDGKEYVWTYNSSKAFEELFPYMKRKSIERWLRELEEDGIIFSGNFNKSKYDKTKWYSMFEFSMPQNEPSEEDHEPSEEMYEAPIPYINTNINTDIKKQEKEKFDSFRKKYPGTKRGLDTEFTNFKKKHKDWKAVLEELEAIVDEQIRRKNILKSQDIFVPEWKNLQTWINQRSWEEEIPLAKKSSIFY